MTKSDLEPGGRASRKARGLGVGIGLLAAAALAGFYALNHERPDVPAPALTPVPAPDPVPALDPTSKQGELPSPTVEDARLYLPTDLEGIEVEAIGLPDIPNSEKRARITLRPTNGPGTVVVTVTQSTTPVEKMGGKNPVWVTVDGAKAFQSGYGSWWATTWKHQGLTLRVNFENLGSSDDFLREQSLAFASMVEAHAKRVREMTARQRAELLQNHTKQ